MHHPLETELQTFAQLEPQLAATRGGLYVLVKDRDVIGVFQKQYDAIEEGYRRFGNEPFLVKKITTARRKKFA
ncbi:MAG TPA: hypothetical protein VEK08_17530 [Planctomycetota bacterium]|nr:hypothetical protein [Planctomycetota bacterium]